MVEKGHSLVANECEVSSNRDDLSLVDNKFYKLHHKVRTIMINMICCKDFTKTPNRSTS